MWPTFQENENVSNKIPQNPADTTPLVRLPVWNIPNHKREITENKMWPPSSSYLQCGQKRKMFFFHWSNNTVHQMMTADETSILNSAVLFWDFLSEFQVSVSGDENVWSRLQYSSEKQLFIRTSTIREQEMPLNGSLNQFNLYTCLWQVINPEIWYQENHLCQHCPNNETDTNYLWIFGERETGAVENIRLGQTKPKGKWVDKSAGRAPHFNSTIDKQFSRHQFPC